LILSDYNASSLQESLTLRNVFDCPKFFLPLALERSKQMKSKKLDAGCTNTCIDQIFYSIADLIDGQMICGAGGGGFLQVILKRGITKQELKARLKEVFQDSGVDVYDGELIFD
jgi:galactokinase/mevalonate kinase-like predicted kinase